jgi:Tol biopolymer transport system component
MIAHKYKLLLLFVVLVHTMLSSQVIQLTPGNGKDYQRPTLSPDGNKIAFSSNKHGTYHIWIMDIDGKNLREITSLAWDHRPAWSPKNDIIAFQSYGKNRKNGRFSIWMVNVKNLKTWEFIKPDSTGDQTPRWSPDGKMIVWSHGKRLWISPMDNPQKAKPLTIKPEWSYEYCGDWSPDGKWIAYIALKTFYGDENRICIIQPDGQNQSILFNGIFAEQLKWSKNSQFIYFNNDKSIIRLNIKTGAQEKLFDWLNGNNGFDISLDEQFFFYDDCGPNHSGNIFRKSFYTEK